MTYKKLSEFDAETWKEIAGQLQRTDNTPITSKDAEMWFRKLVGKNIENPTKFETFLDAYQDDPYCENFDGIEPKPDACQNDKGIEWSDKYYKWDKIFSKKRK